MNFHVATKLRQKRGSTFNACCPSSMKLRDWLGKDVRPKDARKIQLTSQRQGPLQ